MREELIHDGVAGTVREIPWTDTTRSPSRACAACSSVIESDATNHESVMFLPNTEMPPSARYVVSLDICTVPVQLGALPHPCRIDWIRIVATKVSVAKLGESEMHAQGRLA